MFNNYYATEAAEMVTFLSDEKVATGKDYAWKGHMGGILLSFGTETVFLQPGDDSAAFLDAISTTNEVWTDEHVIMEYFYY